MLDFEIYTDKIAESGRRLIRKAFDEALNRDHNQIAPEHILISIAEVEHPFFNKVMQSLNLDPQVVLQALETKLGQREYIGRGIKMTESFRTMLANALKNARMHHRRLIELNDCFIALFQNEENYIVKLFQQFGVDRKMVIQEIQSHAGNLNRG
jgi:ATP-dependent Clp protease ATP-binding subunit ClpA